MMLVLFTARELKFAYRTDAMVWKQISDRKWELKKDDLVLATIFHKPVTDEFSLFVQSPPTYRKIINIAAKTYLYKSLDEAQQGFVEILTDRVAPYARTMLAALSEIECEGLPET